MARKDENNLSWQWTHSDDRLRSILFSITGDMCNRKNFLLKLLIVEDCSVQSFKVNIAYTDQVHKVHKFLLSVANWNPCDTDSKQL